MLSCACTSCTVVALDQQGIASSIGEFRIAWSELMAGAAIATVPTILVYSFRERYFVQGLTAGAVKG